MTIRTVVVTALIAFVTLTACAQVRVEIASIAFEGAVTFRPDRLRGVIQSQETPWAFWKWLNTLSADLGSEPQYYDPQLVESDLYSLRRFYEDQGFYAASIDTSVRIEDDRAYVAFRISEGVRSIIDTFTIQGIDGLSNDVRSQVSDGALIQAGDPFIYTQVEAEFRRLIELFSNNGYVNVVTRKKEAVGRDNAKRFSVLFDFDPGSLHRFGDVTVVVDTNSVEPVDRDIVLRHLDFRPGDVYSEQRKLGSERLLNRLGIFDATRIENAGQVVEGNDVKLPMRVTVRTRAYQELAPELGFNDEDNAFNVVGGLAYSHRNFFGGARNFSTVARLSLRSLGTAHLGRLFQPGGLRDSALVSKVEVTTQIIQPYFFSNKVSLTGSFSAILDKQRTYYVPIFRTKAGVTAQTATYTRLFADWNLEWIDPRSVTTQQDTALELFQRQFNSILTLTLQRDMRNDIFSPTSGSVQTAVFEEAGFLPRQIGGLIGRQLPYSQYLKLVLIGQWYWDPGEPRGAIWAAKARVGVAELYGSSPTDVPITRKFFGGGSGSVRGWKARELGVLENPALGGNALIEASIEDRLHPLDRAGEFLFLDLSKISFVLFADAGNVWKDGKQIRLSEMALAAGFGIRYETVAGPIRFDLGMKVYDPSVEPGRRWVTQRQFSLGGAVLHLGIGHAF